jgi:hypothetical protein
VGSWVQLEDKVTWGVSAWETEDMGCIMEQRVACSSASSDSTSTWGSRNQ